MSKMENRDLFRVISEYEVKILSNVFFGLNLKYDSCTIDCVKVKRSFELT